MLGNDHRIIKYSGKIYCDISTPGRQPNYISSHQIRCYSWYRYQLTWTGRNFIAVFKVVADLSITVLSLTLSLICSLFQQSTGQEVAVKTIKKAMVKPEDNTEIEVLKKLNHPNIVHYHDTDTLVCTFVFTFLGVWSDFKPI